MSAHTIFGDLINDQTIGLQDDDIAYASIPAAFATFLATLSLTGAQTSFATANGAAESDDPFFTIDPDGSAAVSDVRFTDSAGGTLDGDATFLTDVDGNTIYLFEAVDGDVVIGTTDPTGTDDTQIVFAGYLDVTGEGTTSASGVITWVTFAAIAHGTPGDGTTPPDSHDELVNLGDTLHIGFASETLISFEDAPAGQNLFVTVGEPTLAVVAVGQDPVVDAAGLLDRDSDSVNSSKVRPSALASENNWIDPADNQDPNGEGVWITFVNNVPTDFLADKDDPNGLSSTEAVDQQYIQFGSVDAGATGIIGSVARAQGSDPADVRISLYHTTTGDQADFIDGVQDNSADTEVTAGAVRVFNALGEKIYDSVTPPPGGNDPGISVILGTDDAGDDVEDHQVIINGLFQDYKVEVDSTGGLINRFLWGAEKNANVLGFVGLQQTGGDHFNIGDQIIMDDDGPSIDLALNGTPMIVLDETDPSGDEAGGFIAQASASAATLFSSTEDPGTDGEDTTQTVWAFADIAADTDSGLDDSQTGDDVLYNKINATTIVGTIDGGATEVIRYTINSATGEVTASQSRAVVHPDAGPPGPDHDETLTHPGTDLIQVTKTIFDNDDDFASDTQDITGVFKIKDDGPSIDLALNGTPMVVLDETDPSGDEAGGFIAQASASAATLFTSTEDAGEDGQDSTQTVWAFADIAADTDSGLDDSQTGDDVLYNKINATTIVGTIDGGATEVIRYTINSATGEVTASQSRAVVHPDAGPPGPDHDETLTHPGTDLIQVTKTIFDNDDDFASDTQDITGVFKIKDDGPSITVTAAAGADITTLARNLDETINASGGDNYQSGESESNGVTPNGNADDTGNTTPVWETAPTGFAGATEAIGELSTSVGQVAALFDATDVDFGSDGPGDLNGDTGRTDTLSFQLGAPVETTLAATAVDLSPLDGLDLASRTIWLVQVSDTVVEGRVPGTDGVLGTGGDDYVILRITLTNPTDPPNATLVYEQFAPVVHADPNLSDEEADLLTTQASDFLALRWTSVAEDGDDDFDSDFHDITLFDDANTVLSIDDDGPSAGTFETFNLEEDDIANAQSTGLDEDGSATNDVFGPVNLNLQITQSSEPTLHFAIKNDAISLAALAAANAGLTSQGETVVFDVSIDDKGNADPDDDVYTLHGFVEDGTNPGFQSAEDREVFQWTVTAAGMATMQVIDQLDHLVEEAEERNEADDDDDGQEETTLNTPTGLLAFSSILHVTEGDGDIVVLPDDFIFYAVEDDMPDIGDDGRDNVAAGDEDEVPDKLISFAAGSGDGETTLLEARIGTDENEGGGGVTITGFDATISYAAGLTLTAQLSGDGKQVSYVDTSNGDLEYFRLTIDDTAADSSLWSYEWEAFQNPPPVSSSLDFDAIKAGGPQEILSVPTTSNGTYVHFDSLFIGSGTTANNWTPPTSINVSAAFDNDGTNVSDIPFANFQLGNPDSLGFGHSDGQASQFNHNEGFWAAASSDAAGTNLVDMFFLDFALQFIGNTRSINVEWITIDLDDPDGPIEAIQSTVVNVNTGKDKNVPVPVNGETGLTSPDGEAFDAIYVRTWFDDGNTNKGVRLLEFEIGEPQPTEDQIFNWEVTITDDDGDYDVATFETGVDGTLENADGMVIGVDDTLDFV